MFYHMLCYKLFMITAIVTNEIYAILIKIIFLKNCCKTLSMQQSSLNILGTIVLAINYI